MVTLQRVANGKLTAPLEGHERFHATVVLTSSRDCSPTCCLCMGGRTRVERDVVRYDEDATVA